MSTEPHQPRTLTAEQVQAVSRRMISVEPLLHTAPADRVLERLGWARCEDDGDDRTVTADPGFDVAKCLSYLDLDRDGTVSRLSTGLCDNLPLRTPGRAELHRDAFAVAARALAESFGPPHTTEMGDNQSILTWRLGDAVLELGLSRLTVRLAMLRTAEYDRLVALSEHEQ
ncbi:hypothetical protein Drose_12150 [Dactylosporangium roseum]|uniref:Uncharacterized protein n=1 Tax=Dactylosporangium roseum TaxID=47989 RepID=A0ABY5Z9Y1_9ACTN|nr:DUF6301 family protein [Dactylosporangium roseum]UWZ38901.1 hypothetical protein Drose_12150 [Dactylosporangium roseum]